MAPTVTHVIFDMDGLILDTERLYTVATQNVVGEFGKVFTGEIKVKQMGKHSHESAEILIKELDLPLTVDEMMSRMKSQFPVLFPHAKILPGVEQLVNHLHTHGIPICVATSSSEQSYKLKTGSHSRFFSLFHHIVLGSTDPEVMRGKPEPDIFHVAASRFLPPPQADDYGQVLVFEDACNGVEAARRAGMTCVMVPDKELPIDERYKNMADEVIYSMEEFIPERYGLPAY